MAEYVGKPAAMVVGMGFATNSLVIPAIVSKGDLLLSDEQNHRSIAEGARMSGAKIKPFRCAALSCRICSPKMEVHLLRGAASPPPQSATASCRPHPKAPGRAASSAPEPRSERRATRRHNDAEHLEELLQEALLGPVHYNRLLVLVEGIYSMEGELCDLPAIVQVRREHTRVPLGSHGRWRIWCVCVCVGG